MWRFNCQGFSTLQATAGLMISGVLSATAVSHLPELMTTADEQVTRYAASTEAIHNAVWQTYQEAASDGAVPEKDVFRHGFEVKNDLVHSPLDGYCFERENPLETMGLCQLLTSE
ncbi:MAG: hypothetical protein ABNH15_04535 [Alcanivorax sp.]|jgi:hypothetical protein|nr:hypothetical protein [Thalassolituus sp.]PHR99668.1 MAG: hypothetical protein COA68_08245 [Oceanobacter sp.]|tara:strand:- start:12741 stop:13085 length:345 start_codon:yes stop_codon:yes gene_type:complete